MKLNAQSKNTVAIGTILKDTASVYIVSNLWTCGKSIYITLTDTDTKQNLYGLSISSCYGMEIKKIGG